MPNPARAASSGKPLPPATADEAPRRLLWVAPLALLLAWLLSLTPAYQRLSQRAGRLAAAARIARHAAQRRGGGRHRRGVDPRAASATGRLALPARHLCAAGRPPARTGCPAGGVRHRVRRRARRRRAAGAQHRAQRTRAAGRRHAARGCRPTPTPARHRSAARCRLTGRTPPWPALQPPTTALLAAPAASAAVGVVSVQPDDDGRLRQLPLLHAVQGRALPSLPLAVLEALQPGTPLEYADGRYRLGAHRWPVDTSGRIAFKLPAREAIATTSFQRVGSGRTRHHRGPAAARTFRRPRGVRRQQRVRQRAADRAARPVARHAAAGGRHQRAGGR